MAGGGQSISVAEALEKQVGLNLEEVPTPTKVVVVESVLRKPTDNPPGVKDAPGHQCADAIRGGRRKARRSRSRARHAAVLGLRMQPGGRFVAQGLPMRLLLFRAFDVIPSTRSRGRRAGWIRSGSRSRQSEDYPGDGPTGMGSGVSGATSFVLC